MPYWRLIDRVETHLLLDRLATIRSEPWISSRHARPKLGAQKRQEEWRDEQWTQATSLS